MFPNGPGDPSCPDQFSSTASFKILRLDGSTVVQGEFEDPATTIGRSDRYEAGELYDGTDQAICEGGSPSYPNTAAQVDPPCRPANEWFVFDTPVFFDAFFGPLNNVYWSDKRGRVATEVLSMELVVLFGPAAGTTIRAGQPYYDDVAGFPQERYYQQSTGEVASRHSPDYFEPGGTGQDHCQEPLCCGGSPPCNYFPPECGPPCYDIGQDFECTDTTDQRCVPLDPRCRSPQNQCFAASFFNLHIQVEIPSLMKKVYNKTPLLVKASINDFPPDFAFPQSLYVHDPDFGGLALFDEEGLPFGYLVSGGHGSQPGGPTLPNDSPLVLACPAAFSVDQGTDGLDPTVTMRPPNDVFADRMLDEKKVTVYLSSGSNPGSIPDLSNARDPVLRGMPPEFAPDDRISSFSYGRDGAAGEVKVVRHPELWDPIRGPFATLFFSVSDESQGEVCSDVWYNSSPTVPEQAADIYASRCGPFGSYDDSGAIFIPFGTKNLLAADGTFLGLRPLLMDPVQDDITGLELAEFDSAPPTSDLFYATFAGGSFSGPGERATIYLYDPSAGGPFEPGNLTVFADQAGISMTPSDLGLVDDDVIDALVLSDITPPGPPGGAPPPCPQQPNGVMDPGSDQVLFSLAPLSPSLGGNSAADVFISSFDGSFALFRSHADLGLLLDDDIDALDIKGFNSEPGGACCFPGTGGCVFVTQDACDELRDSDTNPGFSVVYLGDSTTCLGDADLNGMDDACQGAGCYICPGSFNADVNGDGRSDGLDIQAFVRCLLGAPLPSDICGRADANRDGLVDLDDVSLFVTALLLPSCQAPDQQGHGAGAVVGAVSDLNPLAGFKVAGNFTPAANTSITRICWWGLYHDFTANQACNVGGTPPPPPLDVFTVTYYADDGSGAPAAGQPDLGMIIGGPFSTTAIRVPTGLQVAGHDEFQYQALHAPVSVTAGTCYWVEVVNNTTGSCEWLWETAPPGDNWSAQDTGSGYFPRDFDLAYCLDVSIATNGCGIRPPPSNDLCANATPAGEGVFSFDTRSATTDAFPRCTASDTGSADGPDQDVWFLYTASVSGDVCVSLCAGTGYDAYIAVYDTSILCVGNEIDCSDDTCGIISGPPFAQLSGVSAGEQFMIRCGGWNTNTGLGTLTITPGTTGCP
jgi:hypothetical protein